MVSGADVARLLKPTVLIEFQNDLRDSLDVIPLRAPEQRWVLAKSAEHSHYLISYSIISSATNHWISASSPRLMNISSSIPAGLVANQTRMASKQI